MSQVTITVTLNVDYDALVHQKQCLFDIQEECSAEHFNLIEGLLNLLDPITDACEDILTPVPSQGK
jgi:hypothetical protein